MRSIHHMAQSVEGALKNYTPKQFERHFADAFTDRDGRLIHPREARRMLQDLYDKGVRVIPIGDGCDAFDPVTGCPGHPVEEEHQECPANAD